MKINENKIKTKYSLTAIKKDDSQNIDNSKKYSIFEDKEIKGKLFYIMPEKFSGYELYNSLISQLKSYIGIDINVNLDSFLSIIDSNDNEKFFFSLTPALNFISKTPYTRKTKEVKTVNFNLLFKDIKKYESILNESLNISSDQTFCRKLQDMPSADMYPQTFVDEMENLFSDVKSKVKISIMSYDELVKKGLLLLTGVGKAADEEKFLPKLMVIEYNNSSSKDKYAFVGKGVCFDTGGMNIKTGPNMRWMKYDMSGAAIVGSALHSLVKNEIKTNVVAVMPLVLNLVSSNAQRPDDIITSYSGKTVEMDNTDAEGRLILADALTYAAKDLKATHLFDVATLTGAMVYSLGDTYTGVWSTSDEIWKQIEDASIISGEQVWRLPFHHEFTKMLKSNFADIANSVSGPKAGSSRAACFLKEFTMKKHYSHFDVAATADKDNIGTGIILRTLYNIAKSQ